MISVTQHIDDAILVVGLGKSGQSAARALTQGGARVKVWDDDADKRIRAQSDGLFVIDIESEDLSAIDGIIWSPGIPHTHPSPHPLAIKALAAGHVLRCDIDLLAAAQPDARFIGITGTNGKSTTTALIGHIFKTAGQPVEVGGNLGTPVLDLEPLDHTGLYVLELSSYQAELTPSLSCETAVLLNITPDHIDRHGSFEGYVDAKASLFARQRSGATAIVGFDDAEARSIYDALPHTHSRIAISSASALDNGVYVQSGRLVDVLDGKPSTVSDLSEAPALPGAHNWQNAAASYAVARIHGTDPQDIAAAFITFPGLPHRQEVVGSSAGVTYVNDSKATNVDAAEKALSCYSCIYWIAGGQAKEGGLSSLTPVFGQVRRAYLIGEAAEDFANTLSQNKVPVSVHGSLDEAVTEARAQAEADGEAGATVLFSPACASFDMFESFEHRGDIFRTAVHRLLPAIVTMAVGRKA